MPNMSESIPEVLKRVARAPGKKEKSAILRAADTPTLQTILQGAFHPNIVWELPGGAPPYKPDPSPYGMCPSILEREVRKLLYLCRNPKMVQNPLKREGIFMQMLESIHPSEALLLVEMKDKKIVCSGLTQLLVHEVWPDLVPKP